MNNFETVELTRDCEAILIPVGVEILLQEGSEVQIYQDLGDSITVNINGNLARISGMDADAIGREPLEFDPLEPSIDTPEGEVDQDLIWHQLKTCFDPEIPVNIVELGLVYQCEVVKLPKGEGRRVEVEMTLTAPGCGMGPVLIAEIEEKLKRIPNVSEVHVEMVFDPPWDRSMISEEARLILGMF